MFPLAAKNPGQKARAFVFLRFGRGFPLLSNICQTNPQGPTLLMSNRNSPYSVDMARRSKVFSIGYEGLSLDEFVALLLEHDVDLLVDVRLTPLSRKPGFSKTVLSEALSAAGIRYVHEKALGNPRDNRESFRNGRRALGEKRFRKVVRQHGHHAVESLKKMSCECRVALMCYERSVDECHRGVVMDILKDSSSIRPIHI